MGTKIVMLAVAVVVLIIGIGVHAHYGALANACNSQSGRVALSLGQALGSSDQANNCDSASTGNLLSIVLIVMGGVFAIAALVSLLRKPQVSGTRIGE